MAPAAMAAAIAATEPLAATVSALMLTGMAHDGIDKVPQTGSWLLKKNERVVTAETSAKLDRTLDSIGRNLQPQQPPVIVNMHVMAMDARSFNGYVMQNKEAIAAAIAAARSNNVPGTR